MASQQSWWGDSNVSDLSPLERKAGNSRFFFGAPGMARSAVTGAIRFPVVANWTTLG